MKLFYYTAICFFVATFISNAQVGVNILSPSGIFHVDPKGDTSATTGTSDDFIIDSNGRVGINTATPSASLDIVGNMSVVDGTEGNYKVMTSDATGTGEWKRLTYTTRINGVVSASLTSLKRGTSSVAADYIYTGANITLPAGQWQIYFYCIYNNASSYNYTVWWDLCTTSTWSTPIIGRVLSYFAPSNGLSTTYASYAVAPTATTTYYVQGVAANVTPSVAIGTVIATYNSGARIWAIPIF
ncbi:hypothetical protein [Dysgonomonas macrotermitis]|uniref:Uncharacterized protein n=1 Tax=Dysgonomonas macrotermitis TaxID=1346286 RepID=A0A1M4UCS2_9BACT|nr:hypothetical protein [Dysgonomonas macrotermitis]SHE54651.1 hypothetical protein SAMN05444362_101568 [Dysgonomonas macrotermitis]